MRHLQNNTQQQSSQVQALNDQAQSLKLNEQRLTERLAQLPGADELAERQRLVTQLQGDQADLKTQLETVGTDAFIENQARTMYGYMMPDEIRFVITNPEALYGEDEIPSR